MVPACNAHNHQESMGLALDVAQGPMGLSCPALIVRLLLDTIHFYFQDVVFPVKVALKWMQMDFVNIA